MSEEKDHSFLIVDDNPINRYILSEFLTAKGYAVDEASNGIEALEKIEHKTYYCILMDLLIS